MGLTSDVVTKAVTTGGKKTLSSVTQSVKSLAGQSSKPKTSKSDRTKMAEDTLKTNMFDSTGRTQDGYGY